MRIDFIFQVANAEERAKALDYVIHELKELPVDELSADHIGVCIDLVRESTILAERFRRFQ